MTTAWSGDGDLPMPTLIRASIMLDADGVRILDRRRFPLTIEWLHCRDYEEVARAIEDMVTQSAGPFYAASAAMVLAARVAERAHGSEQRLALMAAASARLTATRPTNNGIRDALWRLMTIVNNHLDSQNLADRLEMAVRHMWDRRQEKSRRLGDYAASLVQDGDTILTHCWAEGSLIDTLAATLRAGKQVKVICTETRPYLQGARLTAHSIAEMGIEVTVITDNMAAHAMDRGMVSRFMTAADRITLSGHVVNKVGTLQIALAARHFALPYVAMVQRPDRMAAGPEDVQMEDRDGHESLSCLGMATASPLAKGWYPAFDITPPELVSAVATSEGIFAPVALKERFA